MAIKVRIKLNKIFSSSIILQAHFRYSVATQASIRQCMYCFHQHRKFLEKNTYNTIPCLSCYSCSVAKLCPALCDPMDWSTPAFPVLYHLPEFAQTHVHWVGEATLPSHPLLPSSPHALNLFQHQGLFQSVSSSHQVAKVLELQLQHQSF